MTRTEIRFKALTFVLTLLLYEGSAGQGIRSILIASSGSGVWAGRTLTTLDWKMMGYVSSEIAKVLALLKDGACQLFDLLAHLGSY